MQRSILSIAPPGLLALALGACGDGNAGRATPAASYDLEAGYSALVDQGLTANVTLSGSALAAGNPVPFSGTGTLTFAPALTATFNNAAALSQAETILGTVTAAGVSQPLSSTVTNYYAPSTFDVLGESTASEYDVVQTPYSFPTSVVGGSAGILGTVSRYTDATLGVSLGTAQQSYAVTAPVDPASPVSVQFTDKIYDTQNTLIETDVTTFTLTSSSVLAFVSATAQTASGNLTVTAH